MNLHEMYMEARATAEWRPLEHYGNPANDLRKADTVLRKMGYAKPGFLGIGSRRFVIGVTTPEKERVTLKLACSEHSYADVPALVLKPHKAFPVPGTGLFAEIHDLADTTCTRTDLAAVWMLLGHENGYNWEDAKTDNIGRVNGKLRIIDNDLFAHPPLGDNIVAEHDERAALLIRDYLAEEGSALPKNANFAHPAFLLIRNPTVSETALRRFAAQENLALFRSPPVDMEGTKVFHILFDPTQMRSGSDIAKNLRLPIHAMPPDRPQPLLAGRARDLSF